MAGATGYTGREVVRVLRERGIETVAHVRPGSSALARWRSTFEGQGATVDTTPWEAEAMAETLRRLQPTLVFALLGTTSKRAGKEGLEARAAYEAIDYGLTALLLQASVAAGSRPRFVYLSSAGVREGASNPYLAVRARMERELKASGLPFVIAQPSFITGADREEDRPMERITATLTDGVLGLAGALGARRLRDTWGSMTGEALARGLVRAGLDPNGAGLTLSSAELR